MEKSKNCRALSGKYGSCKFCDCIPALKEIPDKSFDMAFADHPYNIKFTGFAGSPSSSKDIEIYSDYKEPEEYRQWCKEWFAELQRISVRQVISPGLSNLKMWFRDQDVTDIFAICDKTGSFGSRIALFATFQPLLFFGKYPKGGVNKPGLLNNSIDVVHVFRSKGVHEWVHPTPRPFEVLYYIFNGLRPKSVIDPFLGSGTTAQVCEELGIAWSGYEIAEKYAVDIEKRIVIGNKRHNKKKAIDNFLLGVK